MVYGHNKLVIPSGGWLTYELESKFRGLRSLPVEIEYFNVFEVFDVAQYANVIYIIMIRTKCLSTTLLKATLLTS